MKRLLSVLLALSLTLGLLPAPAMALYVSSDKRYFDSDGVEFYYRINDGDTTATVTAVSISGSYETGEELPEVEAGSLTLTIPEYITDSDGQHRVTTLDDGFTFLNSSGEKFGKLRLPAGLTEIPDGYGGGQTHAYASFGVFANTGITSVEFAPNGVLTKIGAGAFQNTPLTSITIPETVTEIGEYAFAQGGRFTTAGFTPTLTSVEFAPDGRLTTIGEHAFYGTLLTTVSFPDSLTSIGSRAFENCSQLREVYFPLNPSAAFTTLDGFYNCDALESITIPRTVTAIADYAFCYSGLKSVVIPSNVTEIGGYAFQSCTQLKSLKFDGGSSPLTIEKAAFKWCSGLADTTITLPERISQLGDSSFYGFNGATFYVENKDLVIPSGTPGTVELDSQSVSGSFYLDNDTVMANPWYDNDGTVYYPDDAAADSSLAIYKDWCENKVGNTTHPTLVPVARSPEPEIVTHNVIGAVPEGAEVIVLSGAKIAETVRNGQRFAAEAEEKTDITVLVSLDGYVDKTYERKAEEFTDDWDLGTIAVSDFTPVSNTGNLQIETNGAGAANANVAVFDGSGRLAASGQAAGEVFLAEVLPAGSYTVVAFAQNEYFSSIASETELTALGISADSYGKTTATVTAVQTANCAVTVPALNVSSLTGIVERADVLLQRDYLVPDLEFYVRVNYKMADGHRADTLRFNVPDGLTLTYVASERQSYAANSTVTPAANDQEAGVFYLGLRASTAGRYSVSASAVSGAVTVPLGSAEFRVVDLALDVTDEMVTTRKVPVTVHAKPNTEVKITVGTGTPATVKTNAQGIYRGEVNLPSDTPSGVSTSVFAEIEKDGNALTVRDSLRFADTGATLTTSYFIHAGKQYDTIKNSQSVARTYTYIANGKEQNKYWTFYAAIDSASVVQNVRLVVYGEDGSSREKEMSLALFLTTETGYHQEYVCEIYIEQAGDHVFKGALIPDSYDVLYEYQGKEFKLDQENIQYVQNGADADKSKRQTVIGEATAGDQSGNDANLLFHDQYKISDEPWFNDSGNGLTDADKQLIKGAEDAIEGMLDGVVDVLGGDKSWSDYNDIDDFFKDVGIDYSDNAPYDPTQLENNGYTVAPSGNPNNSGGYAVKETVTDNGGRLLQYQDSSGQKVDWNFKPLTDAGWSALKTAGLNAANYALGAAEKYVTDTGLANKLQGTVADFVKQKYGDAAAAKVPNLNKAISPAKSVASGFLSYLGLKDSIDSYGSALSDYEEQKGNVDNAGILKDYAEKNRNRYGQNCLNALDKELSTGKALLRDLEFQKNKGLTDVIAGTCLTVAGVVATLSSGGSAGPIVDSLSKAYDVASNATSLAVSSLIVLDLLNYAKAVAARQRNCGDLGKKRGAVSMGVAILDPSGIVYEAVESNTLEGVTATIYDVTNSKTWDAAEYDQINPQTTGSDGSYAWDVPSGQWRVDFTKAGYQNASTAVLTVPPPQMNLKTAMTAVAAPVVANVSAYSDYVEILFSQYMSTTETLTVPAGYTYEWADKEKVNEESSTEYSKVLRLAPTGEKPAVGDTVSVTLSGAKNYVGTALSDYSGTATVAVRPASMKLNYSDRIAVLVGESPAPRATVRVLDGEGRPLHGLTVSASVENELLATAAAVSPTTDENGVAVFSVEGKLPGLTSADFAVAGTSLATELPLLVTVDSNQVARPTATLGGTTLSAGAPKDNAVTVASGTRLVLSCETEGASIYYTTNDTCPCQNTAERTLYTGPITITGDTYFRIAAYKAGMEYSERLNIRVTVSGALPPATTSSGGSSGSSGGSGSASAPASGGSGALDASATVSGGTASVAPIGSAAIAAAVSESGGGSGNASLTLDLTRLGAGVTTVSVPAETMRAIADALAGNAGSDSLTIATANGSATLNENAVVAIASGTGNVALTMQTISADGLGAAQASAVADKEAVGAYALGVTVGGEPVADLGGGFASVSVPFTPEAGANALDYRVYRVSESGEAVLMPSAVHGGELTIRSDKLEDIVVVREPLGATFSDLNAGAYYGDAAQWATANGVTNGMGGLFNADGACTRAQVVTFLWRAAGSPRPKGASGAFGDVAAGTWYSDAVAWAVENGITYGMGDGQFGVESVCTRAQVVTFLCRMNSGGAEKATEFADVPKNQWYTDAAAWADEAGITNGMDGLFNPDGGCTRGQIVTFLYRDFTR